MKKEVQLLRVPSYLTQGMSSEDKKSYEDGYRASAWVMRVIWEHYDKKLQGLIKESEEITSHEEFLKNAAERKAIRAFLKSLPEEYEVE